MIITKSILLYIVIYYSAFTYAQSRSEAGKVTLLCKGEPLRVVLEKIREKTGTDFVYNDILVDDVKVNCDLKNVSIENAIGEILHGEELSYKMFDKNFVVLFKEKKRKLEIAGTVVVEKDVPEVYSPPDQSEPKLISNTKFDYPPTALERKIEGVVKIDLYITADGKVGRTFLKLSSGSDILDSTAVDYAQNFKFIPAKVNGKGVGIWMSMLFKYSVIGN